MGPRLVRRIMKNINSRAPILLWMVVHAVEMINKFLVGSDGRTPHYRLHGKKKTVISNQQFNRHIDRNMTYLATSVLLPFQFLVPLRTFSSMFF